jgi:predicted DsbA family dithiol-disulfide isomerase
VPTLEPQGDYLSRVWQEHVYPLAEKMGFTMNLPPVQPRTRLAHAAVKWAADYGRFNDYNSALFKAFFQDGLDIGKLEILQQIAEKLDMDTDGFATESQVDAYVCKVLRDEETAQEANVRAVPAYVANGKVLAAGVQTLAQLQQLISWK